MPSSGQEDRRVRHALVKLEIDLVPVEAGRRFMIQRCADAFVAPHTISLEGVKGWIASNAGGLLHDA